MASGKFYALKINLAIGFIQKPAGMHLLSCNDAVPLLNEVKTQIFRPTANLEKFEINLYFCLPTCQLACRKTQLH